MSSHEFVTVMVKYALEGGNALAFKCRAPDTVFDLARDIKSNASLFDLEEKDVKLNKVEIFTRSADGSKHCFNFNDGIDVLKLKSGEVEFDNHPTEYVSVRVKHKDSMNPIKVQIQATQEVCDLVEKVRERLDQFSLGETEIQQIASPGSEIRFLRESGEGQYDVISPVTSIVEVKDEVINFDVVSSTMKRLGNPMKISVTYRGSYGGVPFDCWENDTVETLINQIRNNVVKFSLSPHVKKDIQNLANEIIVTPLSSDPHHHVRGLTLDQKLKDLKTRRVQFYIPSPPDVGDLGQINRRPEHRFLWRCWSRKVINY
ncbi:uncharacterized protein [Ptychodera flava]|uniref:uncharacterized protein n=1 Tax=Ptychodera flava TaxID=63121 RepID=UPI00396A1D2B